MLARIITPAPSGSRTGNRVTALRWARALRRLGHQVKVAQDYAGEPADLLIALHAAKSHDAVARFHEGSPDRALVVGLAGTDLYLDPSAPEHARARRSLELATRVVVLQSAARDELPEPLRGKTRVIHQSSSPPDPLPRPRTDVFEVCVIGHLRAVKDPLLAARAVRRLPSSSRIELVHVGAILDEELGRAARNEHDSNPRYRWVGEATRLETLRIIARARLLVLTSRTEGGANVVSESITCSTPVLSTQIAGSIGLLGRDYPGYFPVGDADALAGQLHRAETDADFYRGLELACAQQRPLFDPERERDRWAELLRELAR